MRIKIVFIFLLILVVAGWWLRQPQRSVKPEPEPIGAPLTSIDNGSSIRVVATNLEIPWSMVFLPDGQMLVTERPGRLQLVDINTGATKTIASLDQVIAKGEGGLLGMVLHPNFASNNYLYLYYSYDEEGEQTYNRVSRFNFDGLSLKNEYIILDAIPGALNHNGGSLAWGPDGYLYITTGDSQEPSLSQDKTSLAGKILRVTDSGEPAALNHFENEVFSYGHRNPQGLAWDQTGELWAVEHGSITQDELNMVMAGGNYGWPQIRGMQSEEGMLTPRLHSGFSTWAPAGLVYQNSHLIFTGLRGQALYVVDARSDNLEAKEYFKGEFGRLRAVAISPDGRLYFATSNRDGRGQLVNDDDDRIISVDQNMVFWN